MKVGLLLIATNKYIQFLNPLVESADRYFCTNHEVTYYVHTNQNFEVNTYRDIVAIPVEHKPWPWMTLERYKHFSDSKEQLSEMDYLYYCDVDMLFVNTVGDEILGDRVATQHPGLFGTRGTPETDSRSLAYIAPHEPMQYFAGGFNGGTSKEYLKMASTISANIIKDYEKELIAVWHDESHMNRYFVDNPPTVILSPSYCYGESLNIPFERRLLALDKDHAAVRN